jgi:hypothetical protein
VHNPPIALILAIGSADYSFWLNFEHRLEAGRLQREVIAQFWVRARSFEGVDDTGVTRDTLGLRFTQSFWSRSGIT